MYCYKSNSPVLLFPPEDIMDNKYISITEAVNITGKHITTIYKAIRRGKLSAIDAIENSKDVKKVNKAELLKLYGIKSKDGYRPATENSKDDYRPAIDDYRKAIEEVLEAKQTQLMKPLEELATYRLGRIEQENSFLKAKVETLLQELEQYKSLPGPTQVEEKEKALTVLQEKYEEQLQKVTNLHQEKEDLLSRAETIQKEQEEKHLYELEEKEQKIKNLEELHRAEMEQALKQAEEKQMEISEAWKKELELAKKPWWKFW